VKYIHMCEEGSRVVDGQVNMIISVMLDTRLSHVHARHAHACQLLPACGIHARKYNSLHELSRKFRPSCTCATNNKQWLTAEIACPTCATPRQPLPSLMQKDRRLSIWHVAWRFPCTTDSLLADFFSFFFLFLLYCFDELTWVLIFFTVSHFNLENDNN